MNRARARLYAAVCGWSVIAFGIWLWMTAYAFEIYKPADNFRYAAWPNNSRVSRADNRGTLLFFIHPRCPCTRASVAELEKLLARQTLKERELPEVIVVAAIPTQASTEWQNSKTIQRAMQLPNAGLFWDCVGQEAKLFGAVSSGTVMLFSPDGRRIFAGGVTAMRGHEGESAGTERLHAALMQSQYRPEDNTPAFGCRLWVSESEEGTVFKRDECGKTVCGGEHR